MRQTRAPMNGVQQLVDSAPRSKSAEAMSQLHSKPSSKGTPPENFLAILVAVSNATLIALHAAVTALGCLKKEL